MLSQLKIFFEMNNQTNTLLISRKLKIVYKMYNTNKYVKISRQVAAISKYFLQRKRRRNMSKIRRTINTYVAK